MFSLLNGTISISSSLDAGGGFMIKMHFSRQIGCIRKLSLADVDHTWQRVILAVDVLSVATI